MSAGGLPSGGGLVSGALDVATMKPVGDTLNAANRAINNAIDYSIGMSALMLCFIAFGFIILLLLGIIRSQNRRADQREKDQAARATAREQEWAERHRIDAERQERDIASRERLAIALQELSGLMRTFKCIGPDTNNTLNQERKLLPAPEHT